MEISSLSNHYVFLEIHRDRYSHMDIRGGSHYHYIAYMRRGHVKIVTDIQTIEAYEGDFFYIPMGCKYQSYWYGDGEICFDSYGFKLFPESPDRKYRLQTIPADPQTEEQLRLLASDKRICCATLGRFYTLLGMLLPKMEPDTLNREQQIFYRAYEYLYHHPGAKIGDVGRYCGLSESGLYAAFRGFGKMTPNELRQQLLCAKAVELLITTDMQVEEISNQLNFSSTSYFRKVLYKHTGKTPRDIRRTSPF